MRRLRAAAAVLLAIALITFGGNYFLDVIPLPEPDGSPGQQLLLSLREQGVMLGISLAHVVCGLLLLVPRTRFLGGLVHLPLTLGIVSFHLAAMPAGLGPALVLLVLNATAIAEPARLRALIEPPAA